MNALRSPAGAEKRLDISGDSSLFSCPLCSAGVQSPCGPLKLDLTVERRHYGVSALLAGPSYGLFISPFLRRRWWVFHSAIIAHDDAVFGNGDRVASPDAVGAVGAEKYFFFSSQT